LSFKCVGANVCSAAFVVHDHRGVGKLTSQDIQHLGSSPSHTAVATLLNENLKVDLTNAERMMAPKRTADGGLCVLVWNKQDQIAHCALDLTQDSRREHHSKIGLSALPIPERRVFVSRDDIGGPGLVLAEAQHV